MRAGKLRNSIEIHHYAHVPKAFGGASKSTEQIANDWAEIIPIGMLRLRDGEQVAEKATHRMHLRFRSDIHNDTEIHCKALGLRWKVRGVLFNERQTRLTLDCEQISNI